MGMKMVALWRVMLTAKSVCPTLYVGREDGSNDKRPRHYNLRAEDR